MRDIFDVMGKRVLITGASSGLGEHFAQMLASRGAKVGMAARRLDRLEVLRERLIDNGGEAYATAMDVRDSASVDAGVAAIEAALGGIDVLVNNSGVVTTARAESMTEDEFDLVVDTNLKGAWRVAQRVGRGMIERGDAQTGTRSIINLESILSFRVSSGLVSYAASKAALTQITNTLAIEWARYNIRVNGLAPGYIETDLNREFFESDVGKRYKQKIPQRRIGTPADLDGAMLLLVSDASSFMTGSRIVVDGGHLVNSL